jgi:hypothetical protein
MEINVPFALLLTVMAGLSTGIGIAIAFFIRRPKYTYLSFFAGSFRRRNGVYILYRTTRHVHS